jgi:hypothetical protein
MRTYQHTAFTVPDRYDIFYLGYNFDAGVGLGRRRRFLDLYGFRFSKKLRNMFLIEVCNFIVFSAVETVMEFEGIG